MVWDDLQAEASRVDGTGGTGKYALIDEKHIQAAPPCLDGCAKAGHAAADNKHISRDDFAFFHLAFSFD